MVDEKFTRDEFCGYGPRIGKSANAAIGIQL
jgi:hypothetical protein